MPITAYVPGQVEAVIIFKATNIDTGLLWIPKRALQKHCQSGLAGYDLGQWLIYDTGSDHVVKELDGQPPFETQLFQPDVRKSSFVVMIKAPVVYFSDPLSADRMLAYSPSVGRVGSFNTQRNLTMDRLEHAWIAFMGLFRSQKLQRALVIYDVHWVVKSLEKPFTSQEMIAAQNLGLDVTLVNGIVLSNEAGFFPGQDTDLSEREDGGEEQNNQTDGGEGSKEQLRPCRVVKFWTAWLHEICIYRYEAINDEQLLDYSGEGYRVGCWYRFMPAENFGHTGTAISPFSTSMPKGMKLIGINPLKLLISHELYKLDHDPAARVVHVPGWLGALQSVPAFIRSLREARQARPLHAPRLVVELNEESDTWVPTDFDGRTNSPIRITNAKDLLSNAEMLDVDEEAIEVTENNMTEEEEVENEEPKELASEELNRENATTPDSVPTLRSGFGRARMTTSRGPTRATFGSSSFGATRVNGEQAERETSQVPNCETKDENVARRGNYRGGSTVRGGGGFRCGARPRGPPMGRGSASPVSSRPTTPNGFGQRGRGPEGRIPSMNGRATQATPLHSFRTNSSFLDQCSNRGIVPIRKKNLSGVVVSKEGRSNDPNRNGFCIYSPEYPEGELFMPSSLARDGLKHGSWLKFDVCEMGSKIDILGYTLEPEAPFETVPIRNSVQIKLNGYVPRRWFPRMSSHKPIIETDFVAKVVDTKGLCDETFADQQITVWIERTSDLTKMPFPTIPWHIDRIEQE